MNDGMTKSKFHHVYECLHSLPHDILLTTDWRYGGRLWLAMERRDQRDVAT